MPLLPLRNTASSKPAELVLSPSPQGHASHQRALQSFCAGDCPLWIVRAAAICVHCRRPDYLSPAVVDRERQLLLAELAYRSIGNQCVQRLSIVSFCSSSDPANCGAAGILQRIVICSWRRNGSVEHTAGIESLFQATAHELQLQPFSPGEYLRRVWKRYQGAIRNCDRRHGQPNDQRSNAMAGICLQSKARESRSNAAADCALSSAARLAHVVSPFLCHGHERGRPGASIRALVFAADSKTIGK